MSHFIVELSNICYTWRGGALCLQPGDGSGREIKPTPPIHACNEWGKTDLYVQINQLSLRNNHLKVKTFGIEIHLNSLEDPVEYTSILCRKIGRSQHVTSWPWKHH